MTKAANDQEAFKRRRKRRGEREGRGREKHRVSLESGKDDSGSHLTFVRTRNWRHRPVRKQESVPGSRRTLDSLFKQLVRPLGAVLLFTMGTWGLWESKCLV